MGAARTSQAMAPRNGGVTNEAITRMRMVRGERDVGARHDPAQRRGDEAADDAHRGGDGERGQQRLDEGRVGEERVEVGERGIARTIGEGEHHQPGDRQHDQQAQRRREQHHHPAGEVDAEGRAACGCRQGLDGHERSSLGSGWTMAMAALSDGAQAQRRRPALRAWIGLRSIRALRPGRRGGDSPFTASRSEASTCKVGRGYPGSSPRSSSAPLDPPPPAASGGGEAAWYAWRPCSPASSPRHRRGGRARRRAVHHPLRLCARHASPSAPPSPATAPA